MTVADLIKPSNVLCNVSVRSKKHCLELLSELLASSTSGVETEEIFAKLFERERLGSTGLGNGVAFPHCRFQGITVGNAAMLKLVEPVEFDSPDNEYVDLVFGLMVPEEVTEGHRDVIAEITELLGDQDVRHRLRAANDSNELLEVLRESLHDESSLSTPRNAARKS
jgi:PTS system nitrogen regulatory IIA component